MLSRRDLLGVLGVSAAGLAGCRDRPRNSLGPLGVSLPYGLSTLDPHARNRLSDFSVLSNFYEPLVTNDASLSLRPCLARGWENPDLLTWVFQIRRDVRFHDGRLLGARDVVYSIRRLLLDKRLEMSAYVLNVASVEAPTDATVAIRTHTPMGILLNKLRLVPIVPEGADTERLASAVNGTGPYRLERWTSDEGISMVRHEGYWGASPSLRSVSLRLERGPDAALADFLSGTSDFVQCNAKQCVASVAGRTDLDVKRVSSISVKFLLPDVASERTPYVPGIPNPFRDARVRKALSLAIDREHLAASLGSPALPANQFVPPYVFGHDPALPPLAYDPSRARALLAEAGLPGGFGVTLHARRLFLEAGRVLREMLGEAGIRVTVQTLSETAYFEALGREGFSLALTRFGCPTGDASDVLESVVHSVDASRGLGAFNSGRYSRPDVDRLIEESSGMVEMPRRRALLAEATAAAVQDLACIPLFVDQDVYLVRKGITWSPRSDNFVIASEIGRS